MWKMHDSHSKKATSHAHLESTVWNHKFGSTIPCSNTVEHMWDFSLLDLMSAVHPTIGYPKTTKLGQCTVPSSIKFREKKVAANLRFSLKMAHGKGSPGPSAQVRFSQKHGFFISDLAVSWRWNLMEDLDQDLPVQVLGIEDWGLTTIWFTKQNGHVEDWEIMGLMSVVSNIFFVPFHIWDVILPTDELIFFKMVETIIS